MVTTIEHPNGVAPRGTKYKLGAKGGKVADAWQYIWDQLNTTDYVDGITLANRAAVEFGLKPDSVRSHLHRMAAEGFLEHTQILTESTATRGGRTFPIKRQQTHYRIKAR